LSAVEDRIDSGIGARIVDLFRGWNFLVAVLGIVAREAIEDSWLRMRLVAALITTDVTKCICKTSIGARLVGRFERLLSHRGGAEAAEKHQ
jgi:hypothetical protein